MELTSISLQHIAESSTNPRQHFDEAALAELTADIKHRGVLQPLMVRPVTAAGIEVPGEYELVFGHRRLRAAKEAGLFNVPVVISALSDVQVLEAQLVENLQREDLHPLELAQGYRSLHNQHGVPVEEIAAKVGKSTASVYAAMKLGDLGEKAQAAFRAGSLTASTALLIARIPNAKLQDEATKEITVPRYGNSGSGPLPYRQAADLVRLEYMLELEKAPFDAADPELVPSAGACNNCPKRTGAQPELFSDVKGADICTDTPCYRQKEQAWWDAKVVESKAGGQKVLTAAESKQVFSDHGAVHFSSPFVRAEDQCSEDLKWRSYKQLLGKGAKAHVVLARSPRGEIFELLPKTGLKKLLDEEGKIKRREPEKAPHLTKDAKAKRDADEDKRRIRMKVVEAAVGKVVTEIEEDANEGTGKARVKKTLAIVARSFLEEVDAVLVRRIKDSSDMKEVRAYSKSFDGLNVGELLAFIVECALERHLYDSFSGYSDTLKELCGIYGVELKGLEAETKAADKPPAKGDVVVPKRGKAMKKGVCRACGCTEDKACAGGCRWTDATETLCTKCEDKE